MHKEQQNKLELFVMLGLALKASFSTCSTMLLNLSVLLSNFLALLPRCTCSWQHGLVCVTPQLSRSPWLGAPGCFRGELFKIQVGAAASERSPDDVWGQTGLKIELYSRSLFIPLPLQQPGGYWEGG